MLSLVYYGDPLLRKKATEINQFDDDLKSLVKAMLDLMDKSHGVGLAAPQVGYSIRLFILRNYVEDKEGNITLTNPQTYINPKIEIVDRTFEEDVEGCLSIPGLRANVKRPFKIKVTAFDEYGNPFTEEVEGYKARVILHENDHLNGVLYIDRLEKNVRKKLESALNSIKNKYHPEK